MSGPEYSRNHRTRTAFAVLLAVVLFTGLCVGFVSTGASPSARSAGTVTSAATLSVSLSYTPNPVNVNTQTQGSYSITGGSGTYTIWVNQTPPGCAPPSNPFTTTMASSTFTCTPTSAGSYNVMVTVHDSAGNQGTGGAMLIVNSGGGGGNGNGNGSGSGNGSSSGFSLPAGLISTLVLFGSIFIGAMVALAAGVIATAVLVSRGLRRLNETMKKTEEPPSSGKPPS